MICSLSFKSLSSTSAGLQVLYCQIINHFRYVSVGEGDGDNEIDKSFGEETLLFSSSITTSEDPITVALPSEEEDERDDQQEVCTFADLCNSYPKLLAHH